MGAAGGRRMRGAPARLQLPLLLWLLLLLAPETWGAPGCPVPIRSCKCSGERPKGLSGSAANPARRRVVCGGGDLPEPPEPGLLPNGTVTLLLSNNKITGLRNGSFLGLSLLEKLDLRNNVISTVQPGAFLGLRELKRLDLSNNRIGCLTSDTFRGLPRLLRLNISGNIFSSLQPGVFDALPALKVVDFGTEFLTCDCHLRWLLPWARNHSLQLSERTLCAYPGALHAQALGGLQEGQLRCEGALELHTHHLIPSLRQVVFQGDRLPFQCSASYLGNDTRIRWYHNRAPVEGDEQAGVLLAESLIHDCTFITSELTLSHIGVWASGEWECSVSTVQGNASKKVEIVVLETSASYCPAERVANNRGDFRWPRTLAGITAYQSCLQYPFTSVPLSGGAPGTRASRRCDRAGRWEPGDYSHCLYTNDITRVLYTFVLMPINASNALTLAHQLRVYTAEAASFSDMMDVVYVAQMIQKFLGYVDQIKELAEVMVDMASNLMLVAEHLLWLAQREDKACSRIVGALERIGGAALSPHAQHISVNARNVALEAYLIKPHSYVGLTCTAFQRREAGAPGSPGQSPPAEPEPPADQQLRFRCTTGRPNNSVALASIQLPPSLFSSLPAALAPPAPPDCTLQLLIFRNGRLFRSHGNTSRPGAGPGKRRGVATPVIFAGTSGCGVGNLTEPVAVSLRHWAEGAEPMAARWSQEGPGGPGGWSSEGCQLRSSQPNVSSLHCQHLGNVAVLMELSAFPREVGGSEAGLHPVVYPCTALLLLCLFSTIITYILNHSSIHVSRKGWHMLLNLCFHMAMTSAVFAGGITLTNYQMVCQAVGITLHYSSLSTLLWMGVKARVLHKELTWRAPPPQEGDPAPPAPRPMLRFYLIAGGIPLIICGVTAAVNIHNYRDHSPYCWLVWRPSLGAFYIPVALILLITWIYFLCAGLRLRGPLAQGPKGGNSRASLEPGEELRGPTRLRSSGPLLSDSGSLLAAGSAGVVTPGPPEDSDGLYSPGVQLGALVTTHFLYLALWACGALAVSQRWLPRVVCSCLYGVAASALGLFVFTHHCARRRDVRAAWRACCPPASPAASHAPARALPAAPEDGSPVFGEGPPSLKSSPSGSGGPAPAPGPCKLTNLQLAQSQACEAAAAARGDGEPEAAGPRGSLAARHPNNLHQGRRAHKSRAKGPRAGEAGGRDRLKALRAGAAAGAPELPSSESGSLRDSPTASRAGSGRHSPGAGAPLEGEPVLTPSEGSDTSAAPLPEAGRPGQRRSDGSPVFGEGPPSLKSSPSGSGGPAPAPGPCKLTNLQLAQSQACEAAAAARGDGEPEAAGPRGSLAARHPNNLHQGRRAHKSRAKGPRAGEAGGRDRLKALRAGAAAGAPELPSSESGSLRDSPTASRAGSGRHSPGAGAPLEGEPVLTPSEGSDTSAAPLPEAGRPGQRRSASRDNLRGGGGAPEKESKRRSYPLNTASLNGAPKGGKYDDTNVTGAEAAGGGCMKTGLWKSETTV
uniref:Adhesion G protein-coupled receptor A2 n=1 Tax=Prolemur simus TaxID=1328070 RepID=A0A8C9DM06_PROSS